MFYEALPSWLVTFRKTYQAVCSLWISGPSKFIFIINFTGQTAHWRSGGRECNIVCYEAFAMILLYLLQSKYTLMLLLVKLVLH
jgi:hypothetical protein